MAARYPIFIPPNTLGIPVGPLEPDESEPEDTCVHGIGFDDPCLDCDEEADDER